MRLDSPDPKAAAGIAKAEAALREHPGVRNVIVVPQDEERLVAYVIPKDEYLDGVLARADAERNLLQRWRKTYDLTQMGKSAASSSAGFNIAGWNSTYTRQPLPVAEMREWVETTVDEILSLRPTEVLEIGCGTGLLLLRVAPHCRRYVGMDFAPVVLEALRKQIDQTEMNGASVELLQRNADNFDGLADDSFDTVIINSVIQYFPNLSYLTRVLDCAVRAVKPGGRIFIGDVRSLPLLELFSLSVELFQADPRMTGADLAQRVQHRMQQEPQMLISPAYFMSLLQRHPKVTNVEIRLKKTLFDNEMTRYRFDAILHLDSTRPPTIDLDWIDWQENWRHDDLRHMLTRQSYDRIAVKGIKNSRVAADVWAWSQLSNASTTVKELRSDMQQAVKRGIDPSSLFALGNELGCRVELSWASSRVDGSYDAVFSRDSRPVVLNWPSPTGLSQWQFANAPGQSAIREKFVADLLSHSRRALPEKLIPASFVLVDALPTVSDVH